MGPDSTLEVDLQLLELHKVEDVTGDGSVSKKTLKDVDGWKKPNEGAKVQIKYRGLLPDGTVFDEQTEGTGLEFVTDEEQVGVGHSAAQPVVA